MGNKYPFRGPRFAIDDKVRVRRESQAFFDRLISAFDPTSEVMVSSVREHDVPVDPDGYPYSLDYSEQLVAIEGWPGIYSAFHFEPA